MNCQSEDLTPERSQASCNIKIKITCIVLVLVAYGTIDAVPLTYQIPAQHIAGTCTVHAWNTIVPNEPFKAMSHKKKRKNLKPTCSML
ncbi:hypothetical protein E2C01_040071 [Portunus trituberculatus]|uniref:Uncharacterized protein n=1 Tax=Portunus trituberculatus TaxID=210409 RepID=A0A5B7FIN9_PORTR|nr:hypothetical protein [Portunus trituberculatus]